jgi:hypothetical protein
LSAEWRDQNCNRPTETVSATQNSAIFVIAKFASEQARFDDSESLGIPLALPGH